jgi:hypothetical protein
VQQRRHARDHLITEKRRQREDVQRGDHGGASHLAAAFKQEERDRQ